jgi:hypothetical protein
MRSHSAAEKREEKRMGMKKRRSTASKEFFPENAPAKSTHLK